MLHRRFLSAGTIAILLVTSLQAADDPKITGQYLLKPDPKAGRDGPVEASARKKPENYPPEMDGAGAEVYKTVGDTRLNIYVFTPANHEQNESRPAIVFFFGGGWRRGTPAQFEQHCRYLASRGMIAMTADYRVASRHQTKAKACVTDGKSAIRWVRQNAARLGVDPDRIVAGGGSAGGHVAACTGILDGFEEPGEDTSVSSRPNALALFNPALVVASVKGERILSDERLTMFHDRMGIEPYKISPYHQLRASLPPTIIFHGKSDTTVPYRTAKMFTNKAKENGDLVKLEGYEDQSHGFFNFGRNDNKFYRATMKTLDKFLVDIGCLEGPTPKSAEFQ